MIKEFNVRCDFVLNQESDGNDAATSITLPEFVKGYNKYMFDVLNTGSMVIKDYDPNLVHNQYFICDASDNLQHSTSQTLASDLKKILGKTDEDVESVLTIGPNVEHIDDFKYLCNEKITKVRIPNKCSVGIGAFMGCPNLEEVVFYEVGHGCKSIFIDKHAFFDCKKLKKIVLSGAFVKQGPIGNNAFGLCPEIRDVTIINECVPEVDFFDDPDIEIFGNLDLSQCTLHVAERFFYRFTESPVWKDFGTFTKLDWQ
jgi:hypothetical protein